MNIALNPRVQAACPRALCDTQCLYIVEVTGYILWGDRHIFHPRSVFNPQRGLDGPKGDR